MSSPSQPHILWIRRNAQPGRLERIEACVHGRDCGLHRHDTYAVAVTLTGTQSFQYRKQRWLGRAGTAIVLHPDELHDGGAEAEDSVRYRIAYVAPSEIQQILGGKPLPFVRDGVSRDPRLLRALTALMPAPELDADPMDEQDAMFDLAHALQGVAGGPIARRTPDFIAAERARVHPRLPAATHGAG